MFLTNEELGLDSPGSRVADKSSKLNQSKSMRKPTAGGNAGQSFIEFVSPVTKPGNLVMEGPSYNTNVHL